MFYGCTGITLYENGSGESWSIPAAAADSGASASNWNEGMLEDTGGSFTGGPVPGTTYYLNKPIHTHNNITFTEWTAASGELTSGNYYLAESNATALTSNITIPENATVNLCLNGHTLDLGSRRILVQGTLNIYDCQGDEGAITSATSVDEEVINNRGAVTLYSGKIVNTGATLCYGIYSVGGLTEIKGGRVDAAVGINNRSTGTLNVSGDAVITGSGNYGYAINNQGIVNVSGGEIVGGTFDGIYNANKVTVTGGLVRSNVTSGICNSGSSSQIAELVVSGGTVQSGYNGSSAIRMESYCKTTISGNALIETTLGGSEGIEAIGGEVYILGGTVKGGYAIRNEGANVYISGGTLIGSSYSVYNGSVAEITGGTITSKYGGVYNYGTGTVKITDGNITGTSYGIYNRNSGTVTVLGGTVKATNSDSYGVYNYSTGTIKLLGGEINGANYGIYNSDGTIEVAGGTLTGTNKNGIYSEGGYIYLSGSPTIFGGDDIYRYSGEIYAHANGDINDAYEGGPLTVKIRSRFTDGVVVYEINDNNAESFSLAEGSTQTLVRVGDNLIVDGTAPTGEISIGTNRWNEFLNTITFGLFFKETQSVTITADDNLSGIKEIAYYLANEEMSKEQLDALQSTDWTVDDEFNINPENKYIIYAKITDNAGNVTYLSTNGIVLFKDTEITTGEYEYTLTSKTDIVTNIKPGNNTVKEIDLCEPGGNAGDSIDFTINANGYIVLDGDDIESVAKDYYAGDYTVAITYNALGETYVDGTSKGDKITDTVITLTVKRFKIEKPAADSTVFTYNGSEQTYTVAECEYYTVSGNKRTNAGEQNVTVALKDTNTYEWADGTTDNLSFKFNIGKATPNIGTVSVSSPEHICFNTELNSIVLDRTDDSASGELKLDAGQILTVGTKDYNWTFTPNDTGNYNTATGKVSITVGKIKLDVSGISWNAEGSPFTYDGTEKSVTLDDTLPTGVTVEKSGNTATTAGNYTATATFKLAEGYSAENYEIFGAADNKVTANWVINPKAVTPVIEVAEGGIYDGTEKKPTVVIKDGDEVIPASEYTVVYTDNINAGTATVTVTDKEGGNYIVNGMERFNISKADPTVTWPNALVGNAGDKLSAVALESGFTWDNGDTAIVYGDNNYGMTYTPADTNNYNILKKDIKVNGLDVTFPTGEITLKDNKWNEFWNNLTFGLIFKETQSITVTAADTESGVKEIAYYLSAEELFKDDVKALENSKWTVYTGTINVEPDNKYVVYARITDNAGNIIYINSDGIVLDNTPPVIAGVEDGKDVYGDATFTVDEDCLGTVTLDGEPIDAPNGKYSVPADNKEHTIVVTDKTGNQVTYKLTVYKNYKVSFVVDGKEIEVSEVGYGKDAALPEIPQKDGYTAKWDADGKNITADTVITAVYEKIPESPKTGDNTNSWLWVALLFASGISVFGIGFSKKRKEKETE